LHDSDFGITSPEAAAAATAVHSVLYITTRAKLVLHPIRPCRE
jgi:hypothetical protein